MEQPLGHGGFGEVWLGRHKGLKERRVFKFCFRADRVRSLKREVTLFKVLKERIGGHPNIVGIQDVFFDEPPYYVMMDYAAGQDLAAWCEARGGIDNVPLETRLEIVAQVAEALQAAHDAGIIHRDVKPANILVEGGEREGKPVHVRLTDFGIGQVLSAEYLAGVTRAGFTQTMLADSDSSSRSGTQLYMAPELLAGQPASIQSDVYSLGVVLFQLLKGDFSRGVAIDSARGFADPLLKETLEACLAGDPRERYRRAAGLAEDLRSLDTRRHQLQETEERQREAEKWQSRREQLGRRLGSPVALAALLTFIVLVPLGVYRIIRSFDGRDSTPSIQAIAVLPLVNLSGEADQEYFADGMTESLITDLTQISALKVISRTSVMQYKNSTKPLPQIAEDLGVDAVIEGSVQKTGQRIMINVQLIDARSDTHLWAKGYERDYRDILALRREIAQTIAREVEVTLTPSETKSLASAKPVNPEAYDLCQQGKWHFNMYSPESHELAKEYFQRAIETDPTYLEAYFSLANYYGAQVVWGHRPYHEILPMLESLQKKIRELDTGGAAVQLMRANNCFWLEYDWNGAEAALQKAIELSPNDPDVQSSGAFFFSAMGRHDLAMEKLKIKQSCDPLNPTLKAFEANILFYARQFDAARQKTEESLSATRFPATKCLWQLYWMEGRETEAFDMCRNHFEMQPFGKPVVVALEKGWEAEGYAGAMRLAAENLVAQNETQYIQPTLIAQLYVHAGRKSEALDWLQKGREIHDPWLAFLQVDPTWDTLRSEPRFRNLLEAMNFPDTPP